MTTITAITLNHEYCLRRLGNERGELRYIAENRLQASGNEYKAEAIKYQECLGNKDVTTVGSDELILLKSRIFLSTEPVTITHSKTQFSTRLGYLFANPLSLNW